MPVNEFWDSDPRLMSSYLKAYKQKNDNEADLIDIKAWSIGAYVYDALLSIEAAKNKTKFKYPNKPRTILKKENDAKNTLESQYLAFKSWADSFNKKHIKG